jgi:hypothetical protein
MANNDLIKKKSIAIRPETYARLTRLAAELKLQRLDGGMVSLDMAVWKLLDEREANSKTIQNLMEQLAYFEGGGDWEPHNETGKPVTQQAYAANSEANDPQYLEPENETSPYQAIIDLANGMDKTEKGGFVLSSPKFIENEME